MKAWDYEAMTWDASVYCVECLPSGVSREDAYPIFADSEWDCFPPTCDTCSTIHDYVSIIHYGDPCEYCGFTEKGENEKENNTDDDTA